MCSAVSVNLCRSIMPLARAARQCTHEPCVSVAPPSAPAPHARCWVVDVVKQNRRPAPPRVAASHPCPDLGCRTQAQHPLATSLPHSRQHRYIYARMSDISDISNACINRAPRGSPCRHRGRRGGASPGGHRCQLMPGQFSGQNISPKVYHRQLPSILPKWGRTYVLPPPRWYAGCRVCRCNRSDARVRGAQPAHVDRSPVAGRRTPFPIEDERNRLCRVANRGRRAKPKPWEMCGMNILRVYARMAWSIFEI